MTPAQPSEPAPEQDRPPRRAAGDSRERLTRAAVELILEHHGVDTDPREVFAFLTPGAVAERAGVSRGLIYHHWASPEPGGPEPFTRFLHSVTELLWQEVSLPEDLADLADLLPDNLSDVIAALAEFEMVRLTGPDRASAHAILALALFGVSQPENTGRTVERLAELYRRLLPKVGREPVPPLTEGDLAISLMCLIDGFTLNEPALHEQMYRHLDWEPAVEPETPDLPWTLFAIAVEGIVLRMTRPMRGAPEDG